MTVGVPLSLSERVRCLPDDENRVMDGNEAEVSCQTGNYESIGRTEKVNKAPDGHAMIPPSFTCSLEKIALGVSIMRRPSLRPQVR